MLLLKYITWFTKKTKYLKHFTLFINIFLAHLNFWRPTIILNHVTFTFNSFLCRYIPKTGFPIRNSKEYKFHSRLIIFRLLQSPKSLSMVADSILRTLAYTRRGFCSPGCRIIHMAVATPPTKTLDGIIIVV